MDIHPKALLRFLLGRYEFERPIIVSPKKSFYMGRYTVSGSGADCKSAVNGSGGSTPSLPTNLNKRKETIMEKETKFESYTFTHANQDGVIVSLNFSVPPVGAHISTFHDMCKRFASAVGYSEKTIEEWFGESGESFTEYME